MSHPSVYINGHQFTAGAALTYSGAITHAPTEVLHILVNVNRTMLDKADRPDWIDDDTVRTTIRDALDEIALRSLGLFPVVIG